MAPKAGHAFLVARATPKAKGKSKPKAKGVPKVQVEPELANFEETLQAAHACTKRLPTKAGTDGCRA